jgi:hypothetical protein
MLAWHFQTGPSRRQVSDSATNDAIAIESDFAALENSPSLRAPVPLHGAKCLFEKLEIGKSEQ